MDRALYILGLLSAAGGAILLGLSLFLPAGETRLLAAALLCALVFYLLNAIRHVFRGGDR